MTTEEIEKAVSDYSKSLEPIAFENLKGEEMPYLLRGAFKEGLEFADKHWQEKTRWIPIEENLPPIGTKVIVKYKDYENEDYFFLTYFGNINELSFVTHWKEIE